MIYIRLKSWVRRFFIWGMEAKEFLACVLVIACALLMSFYTYPSEDSIRISGYVLQMLGMLFAVVGLLSIRVHFGHPSLFSLVFEWTKRFPKWTNNVVIQVGPAHLKIQGERPRVELWAPDNPEAPIEDRVSAIVRNLDKVREELKTNYFDINEIKDTLKEVGEKQIESISKLEEKIGKDFEQLHTKDVIKSLVGLVWLVAGITLSTLPNELFNVVK